MNTHIQWIILIWVALSYAKLGKLDNDKCSAALGLIVAALSCVGYCAVLFMELTP